MDKNSMINDENLQGGCDVHRQPKGIQSIHKKYGLWIVSVGNNKTLVNSFIQTRQRYFEFFSISHMYNGKGELSIYGKPEESIKAGDCIIIPPQVVNRYGGSQDFSYEEDSICFCGPIADMLYKSGIIKAGRFEFGKARELLSIQKLALDPSMDSQINANIALQNLLIDIYNKNRSINTLKIRSLSTIDKLIKKMKEEIHKWWTVEEMAEFCGLSKDQFRRVFKKQTAILPKLYIDKLKLNQAAEMLTSTDLNISEIALKFDYHDAYHFSRRFKRIIGFSPKQYRLEFGR